jgi:hypothetical protein
MDQRRLRLGDILDDYCPRERRVTNHAVVAMVEEDVKQTRCMTCDAEHVYKGGKAPRRRKSESAGALYKEVLAGITEDPAAPSPALVETPDEPAVPPAEEAAAAPPAEAESPQPIEEETPEPEHPVREEGAGVDDGPVHRPLIRAQLPRPEGVKIERQVPDFTIRHNGARGGGGNGNFRGGGDMRGRGGRGGHGGGQRFGRGPNRGGGAQRFDRGPRNKRGR